MTRLNDIYDMFNKAFYMATALIVSVAISSCEEEVENIGRTLTGTSDRLQVSTSNYSVTTRTIVADSVLSLSSDCYFGRLRDPQTGTDVASLFTTQFNIIEYTYLATDDIVATRYDGRAAADSCDIILYLSTPYRAADTLAAMKMRVTELATPMEEGQRYYSNFSPRDRGMLRSGGISKEVMFSYANLSETDSARNSKNYQRGIRVMLNEPYTAADGTLYNNYGTYLMRQFHDHRELYKNAYTFAHHVCPGMLFEITDGLGFHTQVTNIGLRVFFKIKNDSTTINVTEVLAGTHEVLQTTHVSNDRQALLRMAAEEGHTYLKTPAGLFTEVTLPVKEIKTGHEADSLLAAKLTFQRLNNQSSDERLFDIPQTLLMVQKDSLYAFFEHNSLPDNITSFITSFNNPLPTISSSSEHNNTYTFNNLSPLITTLWNIRQHASDPERWEAEHPDWNKVVLVPITYTVSSSSSSVTSVRHNMSITSTRLVGGTAGASPITINVVYGKFSQQ